MKYLIVIVPLITILIGCGGGGGGSPTENNESIIASGQFKDSNVSGLAYNSGTVSGITSFDGSFSYVVGQSVSFRLGSIEFGSALGVPTITPIDLVTFGSSSSSAVLNRVRLLMTLDLDNNPVNGIEISNAVQLAAETWNPTNFSGAAFEADLVDYKNAADIADGIVHPIASLSEAQAHLEDTFYCVYSGAFSGSYSGGDTGGLGLFIDAQTGILIGLGFSNNLNDYFVAEGLNAISPDYNTSISAGNASTGATFSGRALNPNTLQGTWNNAFDGISGAFQASRVGGSSSARYRVTGIYDETADSDVGLYSLDILSNNQIQGIAYSVIFDEVVNITGSVSGTQITATGNNGTQIIGSIDFNTLIVSGNWSQPSNGNSGEYAATGCRLN